MTKSEMTHFWHYLLIVSMPFAKEGKILIQILSNIKNYNAKDLVREFLSKGWNVGLVYKTAKAADCWVSWPSSRQQQTITLILFTNW